MSKEVKAQAGDSKMIKHRNSFEPEFVEIKAPTDTRLEHLHTHVLQNKDEHVVERIYRNRNHQHFLYKRVYRSSYLQLGATWQITNLRIHPVIPYSGN